MDMPELCLSEVLRSTPELGRYSLCADMISALRPRTRLMVRYAEKCIRSFLICSAVCDHHGTHRVESMIHSDPHVHFIRDVENREKSRVGSWIGSTDVVMERGLEDHMSGGNNGPSEKRNMKAVSFLIAKERAHPDNRGSLAGIGFLKIHITDTTNTRLATSMYGKKKSTNERRPASARNEKNKSTCKSQTFVTA